MPVYNNIKEYEYDPQTDGLIDIITAGYPCQPFSTAGSLKGEDDPRHLWPDVFRIVKSIRPTWCIFENVPNHLNMGFATVRDDMESQGYQIQALVIPAIAADANHIRDRLWIICTKEAATNKDENHYYKLSHKLNPGVKVMQTPTGAGNQLAPSMRTRDTGSWGRELFPTICARDWKGKAINARSRLPNAIGDGERERLIWRTPDTGAGGNAYNNLSKGITHRANGQPIQVRLEDQAQLANGTNAPRMNPDWVEWFMGYPSMWTHPEHDIDIDRTPLDYTEAWTDDPHPDIIHQLTYEQKIRSKRVRALGNAIVPKVAARFFRIIATIENSLQS